ncbi:M48 family metalloprotease [Streptomyces sp. So13.3]|uniref:M56 family metallopeptidase n=1 Tax=Streptomyces TaxID=1883 RepID=UPI0011069DAC|nr:MULTISPECIES: M56 family metallopeptidase [unclassified Streptomyces]MCZ4101632.1 M56 family metallopeptidase [Streptomyces sp. H39-C1]QNA76430.1 M48 family metalloprotease [Streptomyces sp. So13.3]
MRLAVYLPLLFPALAALAVRPLTERLEPRLATWILAVGAVVLALGSTTVLGLLVLAAVVRIPPVAALGGYSLQVMQRHDPTTRAVGLLAAVLLGAAATAATRMVWRRVRALFNAALEAACFPGTNRLVVLDEPAADAFAMPGLPGRIVVSTGMLTALDDGERAVLLAHECAHLRGHHYLFTAAVQLAAAANPLLRPAATAVTYTVERWADEHAARVIGDRRRVARTVGKAALAARSGASRSRLPGAALGLLGRDRKRTAAGPVPRRVAALLAPAPRNRAVVLLGVVAVLAATALCTLEAAQDLHELLELAKGG